MTDTLEQRIGELPDEDLLRLLTSDADQYRPEALQLARAEARRRQLEIEPREARENPAGSNVGQALRAFADGVAEEFRPGRFTAAGKRVACSHCGGEVFELQSALVNTRTLTFFSLDWLNRGAMVLVCESCGLLTWFRKAPDRIRE